MLVPSRLLALLLLLLAPLGCERKVRGAGNQDDVETPMPPPTPLRAGVSWQRVYAGAKGLSDSPTAVTTDLHGNVLVGGYEGVRQGPRRYLQDSVGFVVKLDQDGRVLWRRHVETGRPGAGVQDLATDDAGNVYAAPLCCEVRRLSPGGRLLWRFRTDLQVVGLAGIPDGGVYVCTDAGMMNSGKLERLDADGNVVWTRSSFPGSTPGTCAGVATARDGGVLVGANRHGWGETPTLIHLTPDNKVLWMTTLEAPATGIKRVIAPPGGRVIVSTEDYQANTFGSSVHALAGDGGAMLWSRPLGVGAGWPRLPDLAVGPSGQLLALAEEDRFQISDGGEIIESSKVLAWSRSAASDSAGNLIEVGVTETDDVAITKHPWPSTPR